MEDAPDRVPYCEVDNLPGCRGRVAELTFVFICLEKEARSAATLPGAGVAAPVAVAVVGEAAGVGEGATTVTAAGTTR